MDIISRFKYDDMLIAALRRVYGSELHNFLKSLARPPTRYYIRVNTLRTSVEDLVKRLRSRGLEVYRDEVIEEALYFPIKGPNKVPSATKYVIADKEASESVLLGADLYIPGVLGGDFRRGSEVNVITPYGDVIAYGIALVDSDEVSKLRKGTAVKVVRSLYEVTKVRELPEFNDGLIYPQSLPSIIVSKMLNPLPNDVVVDMCAAPGGKTGHIVELSDGRAVVYAFDHSKRKVDEMINELRRLGHLRYVKVFRADSRYLDLDFPWIKADKVLIDPPCSSLGVIPKVGDSKTYRDVSVLSNYQFQFIKAAVNVLRDGGILVYSTCTVTCEENEDIIERAINELNLEVVEPSIRLGGRGACGSYRDYFIRFHPHTHGHTGYFIAVLRKR